MYKGEVLKGKSVFNHIVRNTYNQHGNQQVLLGDLGMGEDIVEHIGHVAFVFFTQCKHTLVIVSY